MHILGRIKLPNSLDICNLYIQCNEGTDVNYSEGGEEIVLTQSGTVSLNSFFNSFYEQLYARYTNIGSIYYLLKLEGDFQVSVYREFYQGDNEHLMLLKQNFYQCQISDYVKVSLPDIIQPETAGRIYLQIICLSEQGLFKEGLFVTDQNKNREVSLAVITCTFKKEAYIRNTVNTILQDKLLETKNLKIFIVDNGKTLNKDDFIDSRVKLIPNKNLGGSGGFTRGLIEALQENTFSHFVFMDDDIELESESIYRLFSLYEYAKFDFAVAGGMLDLTKKYILHEAGALYSKEHLHTTTALKSNLDLQNATSLNLLLLEENIDFGGFWFFAFSKELVEQIGLPMPFFIKVDDIEFCLRIKESLNSKIIAFPPIAVWHEPFYAKITIWDNYYNYRNHLITNAIHGSLKYPNVINHITKILIFSLTIFDYNSAQMIIKGFEDYMEGPNIIKNTDPEILHSKVLNLSKSYKNQKLQQTYLPSNQFEPPSKTGTLKKVLSLITLNGHLLPNFLMSDNDVFIWHSPKYPAQRSKAFGKKRIFIFKEQSGYLIQNELNKLAGIKLLMRWFKVTAINSIKWSFINTQWKNASEELKGISFWHQYLEIKK